MKKYKPRVKSGRQEIGVQKAKLAMFWKKQVITGDCTFTGKKYKDGEIVLEIFYRYEPKNSGGRARTDT